jgi:hypothetical protein
MVTSAPEGSIDYKSLTVPQLKALCKERGISGYSKLAKAALVEKLLGPPCATDIHQQKVMGVKQALDPKESVTKQNTKAIPPLQDASGASSISSSANAHTAGKSNTGRTCMLKDSGQANASVSQLLVTMLDDDYAMTGTRESMKTSAVPLGEFSAPSHDPAASSTCPFDATAGSGLTGSYNGFDSSSRLAGISSGASVQDAPTHTAKKTANKRSIANSAETTCPKKKKSMGNLVTKPREISSPRPPSPQLHLTSTPHVPSRIASKTQLSASQRQTTVPSTIQCLPSMARCYAASKKSLFKVPALPGMTKASSRRPDVVQTTVDDSITAAAPASDLIAIEPDKPESIKSAPVKRLKFRPLVPTKPTSGLTPSTNLFAANIASELFTTSQAISARSSKFCFADATLHCLDLPPALPLPVLGNITLPPSLSQRKLVHRWSVVLSGISDAERRQCVLVSRMFRYAGTPYIPHVYTLAPNTRGIPTVYLSASAILEQDYGGQRLAHVVQQYPQTRTNMWPYLRQRRAEAAGRKAVFEASFLGRNVYRGEVDPIAERLWASPDDERQACMALR